MVTIGRNSWRALAVLLVAMICVGLDAGDAYAQSSSCSRLQATLRQFDRNADFQNMQSNSGNARGLQQQVQDAESAYVRNGCNAEAKAGRQLSRQCQQFGREVLRLREQFANVSQSVDTANAVAQQREGILQELARFGCGADDQGSSATVTNDRQSVFDRIFGSTTEGDFSDGQMTGDEGYWGGGGYSTVRTVCVRMSDGYFWPISYSTLQEYLPNDAAMCHAQCPNTPVDLYYYNNPGQDTEQMINMAGSPYTALPTAFAYRTAIDPNSTCKTTPAGGGSITSVAAPDGGTRSIVEVGGVSFPMPMRDPRRQMPVQAVTPAEVPVPAATVAMLDIPLPRPRPPGPGEAPAVKPVVQQADSAERLVQFGDKVVRVVGPDTPYAQPVGATP